MSPALGVLSSLSGGLSELHRLKPFHFTYEEIGNYKKKMNLSEGSS